ncbi:MAG: UDP-N-acetylmuramoyl-L-alanyl-D-glutamate--2,6-diaminopimelate ligase [Burkholderiales bacterium]|jgi:UDP-N-acetylmuramoyl-L-alanyl-D-glutamate--2,6-diaminopimelate ligase|nr:UDP-N-acetylmuramoyl-L-alanyl-D-glutamate--2,6-diaminopimelate ligase [Burkholderiales bacterium]
MISRNSLASFTTFTRILDDLGDFLSKYNLEIDSRKVGPDSIFCAYPGSANDGRNYVEGALSSGAQAIIYEPGIDFKIPIKHIAVEYLMQYVGLLAAAKYDNPSKKFNTIGVTGTNGKTSVTHWLNQIYTILESKSAIIGTTGAGVYPDIIDYASTTPDPITLQKLLADFVKQKVDVLAMEVSSHSLHQGRVNGVAFKTAVFTNLSQDHLDYHKTMEAYYQAKRDLFYWHDLEHAIINVDDEYGQRLINQLRNDIAKYKVPLKIFAYGIDSGDLRAGNLSITLSGMSFKLMYGGEEHQVHVKVIGRFNVYNILAVAGTLITNGFTLSQIVPLLSNLRPVCGRMDTIIQKNRPLIVIDYAHTPDALSNTLNTLRDVEHSGELYCVFGCGGNRDAAKRPLMGDIATKIADFTYITSDNPRYEEPEEIIKQVVAGVSNTSNYEVIIDRKDAIIKAISKAKNNDIILIAGKGHETYQEIKGEKHHFSDFEIAQKALSLPVNLHPGI